MLNGSAAPAIPFAAGRTGRAMLDKVQETFDLEEFLPFLAARVGSLMEETFKPELAAEGLTIDMWRVLVVLSQSSPRSLVELSEATSINPPTLSRLVGRMIDQKLISRERSTQDSRTVEVSIIAPGVALVKHLMPRAAQINEMATAPFSDKEIKEFKSALRKLYAVLDQAVHGAKKNRNS